MTTRRKNVEAEIARKQSLCGGTAEGLLDVLRSHTVNTSSRADVTLDIIAQYLDATRCPLIDTFYREHIV